MSFVQFYRKFTPVTSITFSTTHPAFFIFYYNSSTNYCCSPRGERPDRLLNGNLTLLFQSTPSLRRATYCDSNQWTTLGISIHALLAESDSKRAQVFLVHIQFLVYLFSRFKNNSYILHIF